MGKKILITGSSTGIGAATAELLAPGNTIFLHYNQSRQAVEQVLETVEKNGGTGILLQADLSTEPGCHDLIARLKSHTDSLDALVNNAGALIKRMPMEEVTWDFMQQVFAINTYQLLTVTVGCVPLLMKGVDPCIVNITTSSVRKANANSIAYGASKGAVDAMTRGLAVHLAPTIRVNSIAPGMIDTPFHQKVTDPEVFRKSIESIPLRRHGSALDIAQAIRFVIENRFLTGSAIDINGGMEMR